jgi:hypothetical protein
LLVGVDSGTNPAEAAAQSEKDGLFGQALGIVIWLGGLILGIVAGGIAGLWLGGLLCFGLLLWGAIGLFLWLGGELTPRLFLWLGVGLFGGLPSRQFPEYFSPNEGIWRSGKNGLVGGLAVGLFFGLFFGLVGALAVGLFFGLLFGLLFGLFFGLGAFVMHFTLHFFLSLRGDLPWDLIPFLDRATERLLLRKVGGSYIFVHRLLLDYFAELEEKDGARSPQ